MICISATRKFLKQRRLAESNLDQNNFDSMDVWYVNEILVNRSKAWVFMNDWSCFSFIIIGIRANDEMNIYEHFINGLIVTHR